MTRLEKLATVLENRGRVCEICFRQGPGITKFRVTRHERVTAHPKCFRAWQTTMKEKA